MSIVLDKPFIPLPTRPTSPVRLSTESEQQKSTVKSDEAMVVTKSINKQSVCLNRLCILSFRVQVKVEKDVSQNSNCSAMQRGTRLQFYYVKPDPKVCCKCNSFQVTSDLLNSENLKVAIAQLCNSQQVCYFTML